MTLEYGYQKNTLVLLESLLVGYHDLYYRINYTLCIIHINYEPVYSSS